MENEYHSKITRISLNSTFLVKNIIDEVMD